MKANLTNYREEQDKSDSESPSEEEELESDSDSSDDEEAPLPPTHSYAALMQSLASESAPQAKRRKLEHPTESAEAKALPESDLDVAEQAEDGDIVEEEEEGPETATDGLLEDDDDDDEADASDPFEVHFADPEDNLLAKRLKAVQSNSWTTTKTVLPDFGKVVMSLPQTDNISDSAFPASISGPKDLKLKQKLDRVLSTQRPNFDNLEKSIAAYIFNYQDILYCERNPTNSNSLRRLACLHAVNHVFK